MTDREYEIYSAIKDYIVNRGYPPTVREIGQLVGMKSTSTVHRYLVSIKSQGYIAFEPNQPRTLRCFDRDQRIPGIGPEKNTTHSVYQPAAPEDNTNVSG